ncbi:hypothetical protein HK096_008354 [Nowakowskiella sp. JEL0078]|nr:hypothetical protein HK096_008354 [Nowakowskiella sp. JEL0078]
MTKLVLLVLVALAAAVAAQSQITWGHPSVPSFGQYSRSRLLPRNSNVSLAPVDRAELLVGQRFDISIEVHDTTATSSPDISKLSATINGKSLDSYFLSTPINQTWSFTYNTDAAAARDGKKTKVNASRYALRGVYFNTTGTYNIVVVVGSQNLNATWVVRGYAGDKKVKNLVLFIGDGMAPSMISAARYLSRPTAFGKFQDNFLNIEKLGSVGKISPNGYDSIVTDSANSASAYNSGQKNAVNALNAYTDTSSSSDDDPKTETLAEILRRERPNMCIGIVTTSEIQDATPAAVFAHTRARNDKANITSQVLNGWKLRDNSNWPWDVKPVKPDVLLGGGGEFFTSPNYFVDNSGKQVDYQTFKDAGYTVVNKGSDLSAYTGSGPLLGVFHRNHLETWLDRNVLKENLATVNSDPVTGKGGNTDQPNLDQMVKVAIKVMDSKCSEGWFLMAEAAAIDKSMHPLDFDRGLADLIELDTTVKYVVEYSQSNNNNTGIIVTADHAQGFDVSGSIDLQLFSSAETDSTGMNVAKRFAVGTYQNAGWPDSVIDDNGSPTKWTSQRFRLMASKVDSPGYTEDYTVITKPQNVTNPLARNPAITIPINGSASITQFNITLTNTTIALAVPNIAEQFSGIEHPSTLGPADTTSVHTIQAVDLYCYLPGAYKYYCSRVIDNTELFFIMAELLALGKGDGSVTVSSKNIIDSSSSSSVNVGAITGGTIGGFVLGAILAALITWLVIRPKKTSDSEAVKEKTEETSAYTAVKSDEA